MGMDSSRIHWDVGRSSFQRLSLHGPRGMTESWISTTQEPGFRSPTHPKSSSHGLLCVIPQFESTIRITGSAILRLSPPAGRAGQSGVWDASASWPSSAGNRHWRLGSSCPRRHPGGTESFPPKRMRRRDAMAFSLACGRPAKNVKPERFSWIRASSAWSLADVLRCSALTYLASICARLTPCTPAKSTAQLKTRPTESSRLRSARRGWCAGLDRRHAR